MDKLRATYRVTVIIGLAMMASLVAYLVVVSLIQNGTIALRGTAELPGSVRELLTFIFLGISVILLFIIRPIAAIVLKNGGGRGAVRDARSRPEPAAELDTAPLTIAAVITFALCEVPAVLGLVLYFLGRSVTDFSLFLILSLFSFSVHFPKFSQWEEWSRRRR